MNSRYNPKAGVMMGVATTLVVAIVSFCASRGAIRPTSAVADQSGSTTPNPVPTQTPSPSPITVIPQTPPATVPKQTSVYKDGTYTATGSYMSPGGEDQVTVTLTLAHDVITSVSSIYAAGDGTSRRYQSRFNSGYQQYVVGKNIDSVNLTVVSGSSLTPAGFNDALSQIKVQAKA